MRGEERCTLREGVEGLEEGRFSAREGEEGVEVEEERFSLREGEVGVGVEAGSARAALRSAEFSFLLSSYRVSQREPM